MYQHYVNVACESLSALSSDELKELLNDDEKVEERINNAMKSLENERETILGENRSLAESNLSKEPKLIELRAKVQELTEEGRTTCSSVRSKLTTIREKQGNISKDTAFALLSASSAESEEESEAFLKQLLDGEITFDSYLDLFMKTRIKMHTRKLKCEKMTELLKHPNGGSTQEYHADTMLGQSLSYYTNDPYSILFTPMPPVPNYQ